MGRTEAQKRADKKYRTKKLSDGTKRQINATLDIDDYNAIDDYCKKMNISKAAFITLACRFIIENNIPLSEFMEKSDK